MKDLGVNWVFLKPDSIISVSPPNSLAYFVNQEKQRLPGNPALNILNENHWRISGEVNETAKALVVSEPFYRNWQAYWNGKKTSIVSWNGFLSLVVKPAKASGAFSVDFIYCPNYWTILILISMAAWLIWFSLVLKIP